MRDMSHVMLKDIMSLVEVIYIVFCEAKMLKFIMTVCESDCLKGRDFH
jgi:hypothetical protein